MVNGRQLADDRQQIPARALLRPGRPWGQMFPVLGGGHHLIEHADVTGCRRTQQRAGGAWVWEVHAGGWLCRHAAGLERKNQKSVPLEHAPMPWCCVRMP